MPRLFLFLLLFLHSSLLLQAQPLSAEDDGTLAFKQAAQAVTLLRNEGEMIPLQGLDSLRIAYIGIGSLLSDGFLPTLRKYTLVTALEPPFFTGKAEALQWLEAQRKSYNFFIAEVMDYIVGGQLPASYQSAALLQALAEQEGTVICLYGDGSIFRVIPELENAQGLIVAPPTFEYSPTVAAQVLFGALGARSPLPGPLPGTRFEGGDGILTAGGLRLAYTPPGYADMNAQLLEDSIRAIIQEGIAAGAFPGAQVLVAKYGNVVYHKAFGYHTADRSRVLSTEDIYDLASVSKVTSVLPAVMKLYSQDKFVLDAPLKRYFPSFKHSNKSGLSYRAMLAHHARLRPWIPYWQGTLRGNARYPWRKRWNSNRINDYRFKWWTFKADSSQRFPIRVTDSLWLHRNYKQKIYKAIRKSPLNEEEGYVYSGLLFYLLPEIVENLTGQELETYLKETFYQPLGAHTITYNPLRFFPKERIVPTEKDSFFRMQQLHGSVHDEGAAMMGGVSGNAGLFASANDLAKLLFMYQNYGQYGGQQYISEETMREFTRCQYCEEGNRRGLGFDKPLIEYDPKSSSVAKAASPESFGHSGYTGTFVWADPENGLLFLFLSNRVYPTRANRGIYELNIRPRIHAALYQAIEK